MENNYNEDLPVALHPAGHVIPHSEEKGTPGFLGKAPTSPSAKLKAEFKKRRGTSTDSIARPLTAPGDVILADQQGNLIGEVQAVSPKNQNNNRLKKMFKAKRSQSNIGDEKMIVCDSFGLAEVDGCEGIIHVDSRGNIQHVDEGITPISPRNTSNNRIKKLHKAQKNWITYDAKVVRCDSYGFVEVEGVDDVIPIDADGHLATATIHSLASPKHQNNARLKKVFRAQHSFADNELGVIACDDDGNARLDGTSDLISAKEDGTLFVETQVVPQSPSRMAYQIKRKKMLARKKKLRHDIEDVGAQNYEDAMFVLGNPGEAQAVENQWSIFSIDQDGHAYKIDEATRARRFDQKRNQMIMQASLEVEPFDHKTWTLDPEGHVIQQGTSDDGYEIV